MALSSVEFLGGFDFAKAANPRQELLLALEPKQASESPAQIFM